MSLRPYQQRAVDAVYEHLRARDDNPCVVLPTGAGKTHVIAQICRDAVVQWNGRVIVLAHVRELLQQCEAKLLAAAPELADRIAVYSAGLGRRETGGDIVIAGIQSVYQRADELGSFDLVVIDEAHMIPARSDSMYQTLLFALRQQCSHMRVVGMTATPYRLDTGLICTPAGILNHVCHETTVRELIEAGYLTRVVACDHDVTDGQQAGVRGGEYIASELEALMRSNDRVDRACGDLLQRTANRRAVLVFACGVEHAADVADAIESAAPGQVATITAETDSREDIIDAFRKGQLKYLVNVNVLTTGFDAAHIDCVAMLRPTLSPGLYYQMVGRGLRLHDGKANCLVLDYAGNTLRHGLITDIRPPRAQSAGEPERERARKCRCCGTVCPLSAVTCDECGSKLIEQRIIEPKHDVVPVDPTTATSAVWRRVTDIEYHEHRKRAAGPNAKPTLRVIYTLDDGSEVSEFICFEHSGYAKRKAIAWWYRRCNRRMPKTVSEAMDIVDALDVPTSVRVEPEPGTRWLRVTDWRFGEPPPTPAPAPAPATPPQAAEAATDASEAAPVDADTLAWLDDIAREFRSQTQA